MGNLRAIESVPNIGDVVYYKNEKGEMEKHTVVHPTKPTLDGIIAIHNGVKPDLIIAKFPDGKFNSRLFK